LFTLCGVSLCFGPLLTAASTARSKRAQASFSGRSPPLSSDFFMHAPFVAASIKIERSKRHLHELEREMSSYFARGGAKIVVERDDEMIAGMGYGEFCAFKSRESEPVPSEWSAVIG